MHGGISGWYNDTSVRKPSLSLLQYPCLYPWYIAFEVLVCANGVHRLIMPFMVLDYI